MKVPLNNVCIVMMSAVGDAVHVLPVITAIKRHNPDCRITWVLQPGPAMLVRGHPAVDDVIVFDRSGGLRAFLDVRKALGNLHFDVVINLQVYFKAGVITRFAKAPVRLGFDRRRARDANWLFTTHRIPARQMQHVQDQYFEFTDWLGVDHEPVTWNLGPWNDEEREWQSNFMSQFDRPIVPIVVATSKPQKDWIPERWAEVCDALYSEFGLQPVLVGGRSPREVNAEQIILSKTRVKPYSALGNGGLRGLAGIIEGAALVISPDTGPLHMTVALDTPVIAMFGYSNPKRCGPYRKGFDLVIDAYGDPGEDYPISMENRFDRMPRITVRDVLDKVELWKRGSDS